MSRRIPGWLESTRMLPLVASDVGNHGSSRGLTPPLDFVNLNTIRGDKEIAVEFQPHLNSGLWSVYLEDCAMRYEEPPQDFDTRVRHGDGTILTPDERS